MHPVFGVPTEAGGLSLMPCPPPAELERSIVALKEQGVDIVLSMLPTEEARALDVENEPLLCAAQGMAFLSHPIPDFGLPELIPFRDLIQDLASRIASGAHVVVHCRAGIGRSGMVAAGVLIALGETAQEAQRRVSLARGVSIPDTVEQGRFIAEFARHAQRDFFIND